MNLYFLNGKREGEQWELVPPGICIGREADNDIQLLIPGVSRYHAKIEFSQNGDWKILDLGSTNGTKVNGRKIETVQILKPGAEIGIGEQLIRFDRNNKTENIRLAAGSANPTGSANPMTETKTVKVQLQELFALPPPPTSSRVSLEKIKETGGKREPQITNNIFGGSKKQTSEKADAGQAPSGKKRIYNLLFVLLVVLLACITVAVFAVLNSPRDEQNGEQNTRKSVRNPFLLEYEKQLISKNNVFRFYVRIENNSAVFKLDDLKHQRHFSKGIGQVEPEILHTLINAVKGTDFMKIASDPAGLPVEGVDECRSLLIGYDTKLNAVTVRNSYPKSSFETIEHALNRFADDYGLKTISLSEEEMREEAERSFAKAEELLDNYQARPENLRNAILRYQIAIDFLDQFDPKPKNWHTAKRKLTEAKNLLKKAVKDAEFNINVLYKKKQYADAVEECSKLMLILDPEQSSYQKVRDLKITLEKRLSTQKKKGRR